VLDETTESAANQCFGSSKRVFEEILRDFAFSDDLRYMIFPYQRPLRERVTSGGSFDLATLSGPLALQRVKRFWWSGYAITGVCGVRVILFAAPRRFCLIATSTSWARPLQTNQSTRYALGRRSGVV